jgi:hypothetical protein
MKSLHAQVTPLGRDDRRQEYRWQVDLLVALPHDPGQRHALVRNLSEGGMMLETDADMAVGDLLSVELDGAPRIEARVVWRQEQSYGCQFRERLPTSAVSAAILQAPLDAPGEGAGEPRFEEFPVGLRPTMDELAAWKREFQNTRGAQGLRLVAFRQTESGLLIAIAAAE